MFEHRSGHRTKANKSEQKRTKERDISKRKFDISKYLFIILLIEQFIYGKIVTMRSRIGEIYDKSYIDGD